MSDKDGKPKEFISTSINLPKHYMTELGPVSSGATRTNVLRMKDTFYKDISLTLHRPPSPTSFHIAL